MSSVLEIPSAGFISLKIDGAVVELDAYETFNQILDMRAKQDDEDKPIHEFHQAVVDLLISKGLPRVSHYQADQFVSKLSEAVAELKKLDGTTPTLV